MTVRKIQISHVNNDVIFYWNGSNWIINNAVISRVGYNVAAACKTGSWMLFLDFLIPQYSTINTSYFIYTASDNQSETTINSRICFENTSGSPSAIVDLSDYQNRRGTIVGGADDTKHGNTIDWDDIIAFTQDTEYQSPSLNTILQNLVDTYAIKNISAFWDDHDARGDQINSHMRNIYSYNGSSTKCPLLYIDFTPPYKVFPSIDLQKLPLIMR